MKLTEPVNRVYNSNDRQRVNIPKIKKASINQKGESKQVDRKRCKGYSKQVTEEGIQVVNKFIKRFSTSLTVKEIQIKQQSNTGFFPQDWQKLNTP